jgi:hypothetical protein
MFQMFQLFQNYVANVLSGCCICCSGNTHLLQVYVLNVSPISDVSCGVLYVASVFISRQHAKQQQPRRTVVGAWEHVQPSNGVQQQAHAGTCRLAATCNSRMRRCAAASCACGHMKIRMLRS